MRAVDAVGRKLGGAQPIHPHADIETFQVIASRLGEQDRSVIGKIIGQIVEIERTEGEQAALAALDRVLEALA